MIPVTVGIKMRKEIEDKINRYTEERPATFIIIGSDNCPHCEALKTLLEEELKSGEVKYIDAFSDDGIKISDEFKIASIPFVICYNENEHKYEEAEIEVIFDE